MTKSIDRDEHTLWDNSEWGVVQRIVASPQFLRSHKLQAMLLYVSDRALRGMTDEITEQQIGVHVFGRRPDYNPGEDSIVRSQARFLRGKLELYFNSNGVNEPIRVTIPKGTYVPLFESRPEKPEQLREPVPLASLALIDEAGRSGSLQSIVGVLPGKLTSSIENKVSSSSWAHAERILLIVVTLLLITLGSWIAVNRWHETAYLRRPAHAFWGKIFDGKRPTLLVPGDAGLAMLATLSEQPVTLKDYISGDYRLGLDSPTERPPTLAHLIGRRRYVTLVDMELSEQILRQPEAATTHVMTEYARDAKVEDLNHSNLILLGTRMVNPWLELYWNDLDFVVERNLSSGEFTIRNRRPRNGELDSYFLQPRGSQKAVFCALSFETGKNDGGSVLILQGTTAAGIQACTEFMMNEARWGEVLSAVKSGNSIRSFEILLRTQSSADAPSQATVLALHVH